MEFPLAADYLADKMYIHDQLKKNVNPGRPSQNVLSEEGMSYVTLVSSIKRVYRSVTPVIDLCFVSP
jgi:hypothetical protein